MSKIKAAIKPRPHEVQVMKLDGSSRPCRVMVGPTDAPVLQVGPPFAEWDSAAQLAMYISRGLRVTDVAQVPALVLVGAESLYKDLQNEIEMIGDAWWDDRTLDSAPTEWLDVAESIELTDGVLCLDFDQALLVAQTLPDMLSTAEDMWDDSDVGSSPVRLQQFVLEAQAAGFPVRFISPNSDYDIALTIREERPYNVIYKGDFVGETATLAEAWEIIHKHRGRTQARYQLEWRRHEITHQSALQSGTPVRHRPRRPHRPCGPACQERGGRPRVESGVEAAMALEDLPDSYVQPPDHGQRMRAARDRAAWELGDPNWASLILGAYMYPRQDAEHLEAEKVET